MNEKYILIGQEIIDELRDSFSRVNINEDIKLDRLLGIIVNLQDQWQKRGHSITDLNNTIHRPAKTNNKSQSANRKSSKSN